MVNEITVGEFCPFIYGKGLPERERVASGEVPVYGSNGIVGQHNKALTSGPSVIIGRKGTVGAVHLSVLPCWPIDTTFFIEFESVPKARYAFYLLKTLGLTHMNYDSAVPGLNRDAAQARRITVVEEPQRDAIAYILGALDDKIELNRRMNQTLEAMARAIFKSWFVDFASIPGHGPHKEWQDSPLGRIPKGWEVGCVDDDFDITMGQSPPGETYNEAGEGLPFYQGRTDFGFRFPTRRVYCTATTRRAKAGDTLISVRAPVGDINMASEDCAIGRGVAAARHKTGSRSYTCYFMHSLEEVFTRFEAEGTVFGSIGKKDFHAIPCVKPSRDMVIAFEHNVSPLDSRIEVNEHESRTLAAIRDALLPKLISGELRVPDAERIMRRCV